jgi:hypothetical protein
MTADDEGDGAWADLKGGGGVSRGSMVQPLRHRIGMFAHTAELLAKLSPL